MKKKKGRHREIWRLADDKNKIYTHYGEECFSKLLSAQKGSTDFSVVEKQHEIIVEESLVELNSNHTASTT